MLDSDLLGVVDASMEGGGVIETRPQAFRVIIAVCLGIFLSNFACEDRHGAEIDVLDKQTTDSRRASYDI